MPEVTNGIRLEVGHVYVRRCGCVGIAVSLMTFGRMRLDRIKCCGRDEHLSNRMVAIIEGGEFDGAERDRDIVREIIP